MKKLRPLFPAILALSPVLSAKEITLPAEKARYTASALPGAELAATMCYTCHSAEYALYQPATSPRAYWKATVVKMQKTFGAPIPDTAIDPLTDYLVKTYGAESASSSTTAPAPANAPSAGPAGK
jgi:hypothetical protein